MKAEYKKRHDDIWPELVDLLHKSGISNYSIYLDEESSTLFGYLERTDLHAMADLPDDLIMKRWWKYMADIMRCNPGDSPEVQALVEVFSCHERGSFPRINGIFQRGVVNIHVVGCYFGITNRGSLLPVAEVCNLNTEPVFGRRARALLSKPSRAVVM